MARLERGKGKRAHIITISRSGPVLRRDEVEGGEDRLTGYRRCLDESAAQAALETEVRALLADGMRPADAEAKAVAPPPPPAAATLPIRRDFLVYNEATGFVVTSRRMAGKAMDEEDAAWRKAVARGDLMPISLVQDDAVVIRVVAGAPLAPVEAEEWVARIDHHLDIKDGRLCLTGGAPFSTAGYDAGDASLEQFVAELAVPPGRYRATLYTHVHGVNGGGVRDHVAGGEAEPLEDWWTRTRGSEPLPDWEEETLVGFLLHLEPMDVVPKQGLTPLPDGGWFDDTVQVRTLTRCPRGLLVHDVVSTVREDAGEWTYVRDPRAGRKEVAPKAVRGGPVPLPLAEFWRALRIAPIGMRWATMALEAPATRATRAFAERTWPEGVLAVEAGDAVRFLASADLEGDALREAFATVAAAMAALPDGTMLTLDVATLADDDPAHVRLTGSVHGDEWRIATSAPAMRAEALVEALEGASDAAVPSAGADGWGGQDEDEDDGLPIAGAPILERPGGRRYAQTMVSLLSDAVAAAIREREKALRADRIGDCGDLVASDAPRIAVRGYAAKAGTCWGIIRAEAPDRVSVAIVSQFADGVLVTRDGDGGADDPGRRRYLTTVGSGRTRDLLNAHAARLAELVPVLGPPKVVEPHIERFAEAYDDMRGALEA